MGAGLVCTFRNALTDEQRRASASNSSITTERQILVVSNLIGISMRVLPNPPLYVRLDRANLKLVVDDVTQAYKIFLISADVSWRPPQGYCMCIYNPTTDQRRFLTNPPPTLSNNLDEHVRSAVYVGVLYVLFADEIGPAYGLYSYNDLCGFSERHWGEVWTRSLGYD